MMARRHEDDVGVGWQAVGRQALIVHVDRRHPRPAPQQCRNEIRVAGVFAYPRALPSANGLERALYDLCVATFHAERKIYRKSVLGLLGATNAAIPRVLWQECPFDERYEIGGEDSAWAAGWIARGYGIIQDPKFRVYHSHDLSLRSLVKQVGGWRRMRYPSRLRHQQH